MNIKTCSVMMPFNDRFRGYYKSIFAPAIRASGLKSIKVDDIYTASQVSEDIFSLIQQSDIVLADVTGKNPNVNYELGIAHALKKKTVIITQSDDDVPFDYRHLRYINYNTSNAGWEKKLKDEIRLSIIGSLQINAPTSVLIGRDLVRLVDFLQDGAIDASYEISKKSDIYVDLLGNCKFKQQWTIRALRDLTHIIHGIILDEPGSVNVDRIFDKTNGKELMKIVPIAESNRFRQIILFEKTLSKNEILKFDLDFSVELYLNDLFEKGSKTIFQRANSRHKVYYNRRIDRYHFPATSITRSISVIFDGTATNEVSFVDINNDVVSVSVEMSWPEPYKGAYSYELQFAT